MTGRVYDFNVCRIAWSWQVWKRERKRRLQLLLLAIMLANCRKHQDTNVPFEAEYHFYLSYHISKLTGFLFASILSSPATTSSSTYFEIEQSKLPKRNPTSYWNPPPEILGSLTSSTQANKSARIPFNKPLELHRIEPSISVAYQTQK
jgi:hypothetical protein